MVKFPLMSRLAPCVVAPAISVWMCVNGWMSCNVKCFEWSQRLERRYISTVHLPFTFCILAQTNQTNIHPFTIALHCHHQQHAVCPWLVATALSVFCLCSVISRMRWLNVISQSDICWHKSLANVGVLPNGNWIQNGTSCQIPTLLTTTLQQRNNETKSFGMK